MVDMTGEEIFKNFHEGAGPAGLVSGAAIVKDIARDYDERAGQIRALVGRMESVWQGEAAGAAQRGAGPLATEHELAGHALGTAQDLTDRQAGSFDEAKSRVVPVPPKPEMENPAAVFTNLHAGIDHERQVDEYNAAAQNNIDVMNGYSGASEYNTTNLPASYGDLSDDRAGISVGPASTIDSGDFGDDAGRDVSWDTGRDSGGDPAPRPDPSAPRDPGGATPGPGGAPTPDPGATTPEAFHPTGPSGSPVDATAGRTPGGAPTTGLGVVAGPGGEPGPGRGGHGGSPRGGAGGGSPRGVGGGSPRGGAGGGAGPRGEMLAGPRAGAEPPGSPARPGAGTGVVAGSARTATPAGGMPMGGAGRGRDGEDTERKRPEWLAGGDPDELFDTDVLTAPPTIGAEDD